MLFASAKTCTEAITGFLIFDMTTIAFSISVTQSEYSLDAIFAKTTGEISMPAGKHLPATLMIID